MLDTPELGRLLARLRASSDGMPPGLLRVEDFRIPWRTQLETALVELDRQWDAGPYAQPARNRLREASIPTRELLALYDRLAAEAFAARSEWVITHGEPYGPNLVETHDGRTLLVDWDSALVASRERDLWEVPADGPALGRYAALTGSAPRRDRLRLYRAWYHLAETAIYIHQFRQSHAGDANDVEAWANFLFHLPSYANWPELAHATA
jgi:hypothetical protein